MSYIEIKNYSKKINGRLVLDNINYSFEKGKIYGIAGKNGSGKTMLLRAISGLITSKTGGAMVDGKTIGNGHYPKSLGLVIENVQMLENLSGFENLSLLNSISNNKVSDMEIKNWMIKFNLDPNDKRAIKKYSLGMKQKISLIQAFMNKPALIILDEPTNALDASSVDVLIDIIKETNKKNSTTFIVTSHDKNSLNVMCDEIIEMRDGKIV